MAETLSQYLVTCLTESTRVVTDYRNTTPTTCPNNNEHTIDPAQTQVYCTKPMTDVHILIPNGYYQCSSMDLDMPACTPGTIFTADIANPMRILLWTTSMYLPPNSEGDVVDIITAPDTPIGYITSSVETDSTVIPASATVIGFIIPGLDVSLFDGVNYNDLGRVLSISTENSTITIENATTNSFNIWFIILLYHYLFSAIQDSKDIFGFHPKSLIALDESERVWRASPVLASMWSLFSPIMSAI